MRRTRVGSGVDALRVPVDQVVQPGASVARDTESGEQEGAGETLKTVDGTPVTTFGSGRRDAGMTW